MQFKNIRSFIKGEFQKEGSETRITDQFLALLQNAEIDITGKLKSRYGYEYWKDLLDDNSTTSSQDSPIIEGANATKENAGFQNRIQRVLQYTDVAGAKYIVVVCDGKIYVETVEENGRQWSCLTPNFQLEVVDKHLDIVSYLDLLFFNDFGNNVYYYDSASYSAGKGWVVRGNAFVYFASNKIYFRDYGNLGPKFHVNNITVVNQGTKTFTVPGDVRHQFETTETITITGSTGNDGDYTVDTLVLNGSDTEIKVLEAIPDAGTDPKGAISSNYRIKMNTTNTITGVNQGTKIFTVAGDVVTEFAVSDTITIDGSTGNDGNYTVASVVLNAGNTDIEVNEVIPDATVDGIISSGFKSGSVNLEGKAAWDGLDAITYPYKDNLKMGYCIRVGTEDLGYKYFVLDNGKNQRADDKCQLIQFDDRFIAEDYVEFDMESTGEILNFDYYKAELETVGYIYIFVKDGYMYKINETNLAAERLMSDATTLTAPTSNSGTKQYSLGVNEHGVFVYSITLPDKSDWNQPVLMDRIQDNIPAFTRISYFDGFNYWAINLPEYGLTLNPLELSLGGTISNSNVLHCAKSLFHNNIGLDVYGQLVEAQKVNHHNPCGFGGLTFYDIDAYTSRMTFQNLSWNPVYHPANYIAPLDLLPVINNHDVGTMLRREIYGRWYTDLCGSTPSTYPYIMPFSLEFFNNTAVNSGLHRWQSINGLNFGITSVGTKPNFATYTFAYNRYHQYDKNNAVPASRAMYTDSGDTLTRVDQYTYYLKDGGFNPDIFSSKTVSNYVLFVGLQHDGNMKWVNATGVDGVVRPWRYFIPLGKRADIEDVEPINVSGVNLYFGTDMQSGTGGNHGRYIIWDLNTFGIDLEQTRYSSRKMIIEGDNRWLMYDETAAEYKISANFRLSSSSNGYDNYFWVDDYNSNLMFHVEKQVTDVSGDVTTDKIQKLGSPSILPITLDYDATSTMVSGTEFKYYMAFQFFSGSTTPLSTESYPIIVSANTKIIIKQINLEDFLGNDIYDKDDIEFIQLYRSRKDVSTDFWTDPNLIATLTKVGGDWKNGSFPIETFEDNTQTYAYNPFTETNILEYPVNDIFVHRNRLVLVNKIDEDNSNIIFYSDVDNARAIPGSNFRAIESGDGDYLVGGCSTGNYAYFFKSEKIYAILGDIFDGQLVDISRTIGTKYKNMKTVYGGVVYFLNDAGIFRIVGNSAPENIMREREQNYFDKQRDDSIDFQNLLEHGFVRVDTERREVRFHVPVKNTAEDTRNNITVIYNIDYDFFRTVKYHHNIFSEDYTENIETDEYEYLMGGYDGNIFQISKSKNDDGNEIEYIIRTKEVNLGAEFVSKIFKIVQVAGRFLTGIRITYWIDGERFPGDDLYRDTRSGKDKVWAKVWSRGRASRIMVEISGKQLNEPPVEIEAINVGFSKAGGLR